MAVTPEPPEWHLTETYKALITLSVEALKMLALVNGGAAVAVLTYLGNLAARSPAVHLPEIKPAILWYCGGLVATTFAFITAYITQLRLYGEEVARRGSAHRPREFHRIGVSIGCLLAVGAALAFGLGCWSAADAIVLR